MSPTRSSPTFSVVMPTRNRAALLRQALATALSQTLDDYEVVVADNASCDETPRVVAELGGERVRYLRSERTLSAHDNWERAVEHARGEWITLLSDDDGIVPSLLQRLAGWVARPGIPKAIAWGDCWYAHPDLPAPWLRAEERNALMVQPCTARVEEVPSRAQLENLFDLRYRPPIPGISNGLFHRSALERIKRANGRLFLLPDPACVACAAYLALEPTYLSVDLPLMLQGISSAGISLGFFHNVRSTHSVIREFDAEELFTEVPFEFRIPANLTAESMLRAQRTMPDALAGYRLDPIRYFVTCHQDLTDRRRRAGGGDDLDAWRRALRQQPRRVRAAVWRQILADRGAVGARQAWRSLTVRAPVLRRLRGALREHVERRTPFLFVDGQSHGFADLAGAAGYLDAEILPRLERT